MHSEQCLTAHSLRLLSDLLESNLEMSRLHTEVGHHCSDCAAGVNDYCLQVLSEGGGGGEVERG